MQDLQLNRDMYLAAAAQRLTLTQYLEKLDPSPEGEKLDAFERQLKKQGIITKSIYEKGIYADTVEAFYRTSESQVLFPEYIARQVREAISEDTVLPYLIGQNTIIPGDSYRTYYVEDQPTKQKKARIGERAELPRASLVGKEHAVTIYKFGRAIEASYEVIRRMQIDMLALHVRRIAIQVAKDKVEEVLNVIADGDGNNNAAPVLNLTSLDSGATAGTLTAKALLAFLMEFDPFPCNVLIGSKAAFLQTVLTSIPNLSAVDVLRLLSQGTISGVSLSAPQLPEERVRLFWHGAITGTKLYGINSRYAIEQVTEAGSDIQEADKFITRQTNILTISENSGYSKIFTEATKILDVAA